MDYTLNVNPENLKESLWDLSRWYEYARMSNVQFKSPRNNKNIKAMDYHQETKEYF